MHIVLKTTLAAFAVGTALLAIDDSQADTPEKRITEQRSVGAFSAIELSGPYDVTIDAQGRSGLRLSGQRKQLDGVEVFVRGDTLVVRPAQSRVFQFGFNKRRETVTIDIGTPQLNSLTMSGSGDVTLAQVNGERIALQVDGPGDLQASGAVRDLALRVSGSGDADLQRVRASKVELTMSGPGDVRLADIDQDLQARLSGSGDLDADGLRLARLDARQTGPGGMRLRGSSVEVRAEITGSGDFDACELAAGRVSTRQTGPGNACIGGAITQLDAEIKGSGDFTARALRAQAAIVRLDGPGNATLGGTVDDLKAAMSGSGDLDGSRLTAGRADIAVNGPGAAKVYVLPRDGRQDAGAKGEPARLLVVQRSGARQYQ